MKDEALTKVKKLEAGGWGLGAGGWGLGVGFYQPPVPDPRQPS